MSKDELLSKIWPDVIVTEDSLTRCISEVRAALEDTSQTMVKTGVEARLHLRWTETRCWNDEAAGQMPTAGRDIRRAGWMLRLLGLAAVLVFAGVDPVHGVPAAGRARLCACR